MIQRRCRHFLRYANKNFCRYVWLTNMLADPKELELGCPEKCPHMELVFWRYPDPEEEKKP